MSNITVDSIDAMYFPIVVDGPPSYVFACVNGTLASESIEAPVIQNTPIAEITTRNGFFDLKTIGLGFVF